MTCDRCWRDAAVLVPWTRDLNSKRVLMRCCLDCATQIEDERAIRADAEIVRWAAEDALDFAAKLP